MMKRALSMCYVRDDVILVEDAGRMGPTMRNGYFFVPCMIQVLMFS